MDALTYFLLHYGLYSLFLVVPAAAWLTLTLTQGEPEVSLAGFAPREHPLRRVAWPDTWSVRWSR